MTEETAADLCAWIKQVAREIIRRDVGVTWTTLHTALTEAETEHDSEGES